MMLNTKRGKNGLEQLMATSKLFKRLSSLGLFLFRVKSILFYEENEHYILKGEIDMGNVLLYLGEMDCIGDLIDRVGEDAAYKAWRGKLCYFKNLTEDRVFGVSDCEADYIFEKYETY